jgi:glycerol uptake facilitator-like aquaporin
MRTLYLRRGDLAKLQDFVKPVAVFQALIGAQGLNMSLSNGPMNPAVAIGQQIWLFSVLNYKTIDTDADTRFQALKLSQYLFIYIFAPIVGGLVAGVFTKYVVNLDS